MWENLSFYIQIITFLFTSRGKTTRRQQKNWNPSPDFYTGPKDAVPTAETADGILTVRNSGNRSDRTGGILTVTVPSDLKALQDVSLDTSNGDICIEPNDTITVKNLTLTSENGDLSLEKCHGSVLKASTDNGNIGMEHVSFEQSDLSSENGDLIVNLDDSIKNYTVYPSTSSGDITIHLIQHDERSRKPDHHRQRSKGSESTNTVR